MMRPYECRRGSGIAAGSGTGRGVPAAAVFEGERALQMG
jgi:hypothetical protein